MEVPETEDVCGWFEARVETGFTNLGSPFSPFWGGYDFDMLGNADSSRCFKMLLMMFQNFLLPWVRSNLGDLAEWAKPWFTKASFPCENLRLLRGKNAKRQNSQNLFES